MSARASTFARVAAVARRDATVEVSYQFNLILRLTQVLFLATTLHFVSRLVGDPPELARYDGDYFGFAVTGFLVISVVSLGLDGVRSTIDGEVQAGTLELLLTSPTRYGTVLAGTLVVPTAMTFVQVATYLAVACGLYDLRVPPGGLVLALPILVLTLLSFAAAGIVSAAFLVLTKRGDPVTAIAAQLTTYFAGALFPVALLPGPLQGAVKVVPAYHGLEGVREVLLADGGLADVVPEMLILTGFAAVLLPASLAVFAWAVRQARISGTLGTY